MSDTPPTEESVATDQFRRNLDQIRIDPVAAGPELTIGDIVLNFRKKAPVKALAALVGTTDQVQGMLAYIRMCLKPGQEELVETLLGEIDIEGLGEILNALGEAYTSFPEKS